MFFRRKPRFPTLAFVLLVVAVIWLLSSLNIFAMNIPWLPIILIIIAIGMIFNRFRQ